MEKMLSICLILLIGVLLTLVIISSYNKKEVLLVCLNVGHLPAECGVR